MCLAATYDNLMQVLADRARSAKGITFVSASGAETIPYGELYRQSLVMLGSLQSGGLKQGDKVLLQLTDAKLFLVAFWGCVLGGIIPVPLPVSPNLEQKLRLQKVYELLAGPVIITSCHDSSYITELPGQPWLMEELLQSSQQGLVYTAQPGDIAMIQFSSGSTGEPKGVIITHENLLVNCQGMLQAAGITDSDITLSWLPLNHGMGLVGFHMVPLLGNIDQIHMPTKVFIERPSLWLELAQCYQATLLIAPNFGMNHFLQRFSQADAQNWNLSAVRLVVNGAEPVSPDICRRFVNTLSPYGLKDTVIFPGYGMTEAGLGIAFPPPTELLSTIKVRLDSITAGQPICPTGSSQQLIELVDLGFPVAGCQLRIVDERDQPLAEEIVGHIQISGRNVTPGYYGRPDLTAAAITGNKWLRTGDMGFLRQGRLYITGRSKDIIFVHGQNYYPQDLERAAAVGSGIDLAGIAVCGIPNPDNQRDDIVLFLAGIEEKALFESSERLQQAVSLRTGLALSAVVQIDALPRTASGKIERYKLAKWYREGQYDSVKTDCLKAAEDWAARSGIEQRISELFRQSIGEQVKPGGDFFQMGGDSLAAVMLTALLYDEYQVDMPLAEFYRDPTVAGVGRYLAASNQTNSKPYMIFHEQQDRMVFAFPPMVGLGVAYRGLAAYLSDYAFCCFDLVASEAGLARYADMIEQLQPCGNYVLLGYSSGGNLAFETACLLEQRGKSVSTLVLLDSYVERKSREAISAAEAMRRARRYLEETEPGIMEAYKRMKVEYVQERHLKRLFGYFTVLFNGSNSERMLDTDIHLILAESDVQQPQRDINRMMQEWQQKTKRPLLIYEGFGSHQEMIKPAESIFSPGMLPKNALIIRNILGMYGDL